MARERIELPIPKNTLYAEFTIEGDKDTSFGVAPGYRCEEFFDKATRSFKVRVMKYGQGADETLEIPWGFKYVRKSAGKLWRVNGVLRFSISLIDKFKESYFSRLLVTRDLPFGRAFYLFSYDEGGKGVGEAIRSELIPYIKATFEAIDNPSIVALGEALEASEPFKGALNELYISKTLKYLGCDILCCESDYAQDGEQDMSLADVGARFMGSVVSVLSLTSRGTAFVVKQTQNTDTTVDLYLLSARHVLYEIGELDIIERQGLRASFKNSVNEYPIELIGHCQSLDLALCKITVDGFRAEGAEEIDLESAQRGLKEGDGVVLLGNDLGKSIVPLMGRIIELKHSHNGTTLLRADTPANAGSSGGPLLTSGGKCIGVHTSGVGVVGGEVAQGISLFVPLYDKKARAELDALLSKINS